MNNERNHAIRQKRGLSDRILGCGVPIALVYSGKRARILQILLTKSTSIFQRIELVFSSVRCFVNLKLRCRESAAEQSEIIPPGCWQITTARSASIASRVEGSLRSDSLENLACDFPDTALGELRLPAPQHNHAPRRDADCDH